uniref:GATA-type transcription factor SRE1 (Siderophore uptake regulator SRE1) n=1 Tax=Ganoderma boninense TaxID=34458 RepID=A0A5K1JU61_9APHY|nr:GATA-type transcription factor SRE1 (Siderophore uptake regulator SRE1) [Ganoderma boninense]
MPHSSQKQADQDKRRGKAQVDTVVKQEFDEDVKLVPLSPIPDLDPPPLLTPDTKDIVLYPQNLDPLPHRPFAIHSTMQPSATETVRSAAGQSRPANCV